MVIIEISFRMAKNTIAIAGKYHPKETVKIENVRIIRTVDVMLYIA